jgi:drug/metabolite transporter (DMT)-like permease
MRWRYTRRRYIKNAMSNTPISGGDQSSQEHGFAGFSERQVAYALLLTAPAMFGANMLVARWMADTAPPVALAFWRWFGVLILMLMIRGPKLWQHRHDVMREWKDLVVLGALGMGVCGAFVYIGAETTTATNIGLLYASAPVMIVFLAWRFYGERLTAIQVLGGLVCLVGVLWIIARGDISAFKSLQFTIGDLWIMGAVTGWAVYAIMMKYRPSAMGMMTRFTAICGAGTILLAPFYVWETLTIKTMPFTQDGITAIALLILLPGFGAYQAYAKAQAVLGAARGSLILYLGPVYVAFLAWIFLDETLQSYHLIGAALVLPGIYLANRKPKT